MKQLALTKHFLEEGHGRFVGSYQEIYLTVYESKEYLRHDQMHRRNGSLRTELLYFRDFNEVISPDIFTIELVQKYGGLFSALRRGICVEAVFRTSMLDELVKNVFNKMA